MSGERSLIRVPGDRGRGLVHVGVGQRPAVEKQPPVPDDADDRRLAEPKRLGEGLLDRARRARELGERQRAAADTRDRLLDLAADVLREPRGARANSLQRLVQHPQHRDLAARFRVERQLQRSFERRECELVRA